MFANRVVSVIKKGISIVLASLILIVEEIKHIYHYYKNCNKIQRLSERKERFSDLSTLEKTEVRCFYDAKIRQLDGAQRLICRESSIQVVLQLTLIVYQANLDQARQFFLSVNRNELDKKFLKVCSLSGDRISI